MGEDSWAEGDSVHHVFIDRLERVWEYKEVET